MPCISMQLHEIGFITFRQKIWYNDKIVVGPDTGQVPINPTDLS